MRKLILSLVFAITAVAVQAQEPAITMTTTTTVGSTFSFSIGALANNTPIQVDWGNGTLANYTIGGSNFLYSTLTGNTVKIYGEGISYLELNHLKSLDVTNCTTLTSLHCSSNQLTSLDITKNTALNYLDCSYNQLTTLDVSKNTALNYLYCESNRFTFTTLPNSQATWTTYDYSPQAEFSLSKTEFALNEEIDLSSQLTAGVNTTNFVWKTRSGNTLIKNVDYTESNGKFTFIKQPGEHFYCEMRNATFPELTLTTEYIFITPTESFITMTTTKAVGSTFSFNIGVTVVNTPIQVDWGNGALTNDTIISYTNLSGTLKGNTIKIYGVGINHLYLYNNGLTSLNVTKNSALTILRCPLNQLTVLDLTNNTKLTDLDCRANQLTALDVSKNTALTKLLCNYNKFTFATLPIKANGFDYIYSPQNAVNLAKKQYGLTETVDLSSELTINGNTTNYIWKTKAGTTLTAGTDYNVTNGITTFLKVQTDSVYCEMTNATFRDLTLTTSNIKVSEYPLFVGHNEVAIKIHPNPATENFTIKMAEEIVRVEVYTITGVKVFENGLYSSTTVNVPLTNMPKGALLIKVYTRNGVYSGKVVKI